jgi:hypothetical protein
VASEQTPLDPDPPGSERLHVAQATALEVDSLQRLSDAPKEAEVITDHLVDSALCGYTFAGPESQTIRLQGDTFDPANGKAE